MKNNDSGPKADGIKFTEIRLDALELIGGGKPDLPRSKRKRGFHRALKRKEMWAVLEQGLGDMMKKSAENLYNAIADINCQHNQLWGISNWIHAGPEPVTKTIEEK